MDRYGAVIEMTAEALVEMLGLPPEVDIEVATNDWTGLEPVWKRADTYAFRVRAFGEVPDGIHLERIPEGRPYPTIALHDIKQPA